MKKTFCDRCGGELKDKEGVSFDASELIYNKTDSFDLCRNCWKEFITWIKEKPPTKHSTTT